MRDFVHVDDVAAANVAAVDADLPGFAAFNVCSGRPISILEMATELCETRGDVPRVFEDGGQMRDFVHVDDVAAANVTSVEAALNGFEAFNVCSGRPISIMEVATELCDVRGEAPPVITGQYRSGDVRHIVADPARAASVLGFRAAVDPRDGLREFAFAPLRG